MGMGVSEQGLVDLSGRFGLMGRRWDGISMAFAACGWCLSKVDDAAWLELFIFLITYLHIGLYNT
jgi:hypothetical protein